MILKRLNFEDCGQRDIANISQKSPDLPDKISHVLYHWILCQSVEDSYFERWKLMIFIIEKKKTILINIIKNKMRTAAGYKKSTF